VAAEVGRKFIRGKGGNDEPYCRQVEEASVKKVHARGFVNRKETQEGFKIIEGRERG